MFAFCALGVGALKGCGSWAACGEGRDPSPRKTAGEQGPGLLLWGLHHVLCFPGGDSGPSQASLAVTSSESLALRCLLAGFSSVPLCQASAVCPAWSWVPWAILEERMSSFAFVAPVAFWGRGSRQGLWTRGSKHL